MPLVDQLKERGFHVQLVHDETETSWEAHGWVAIDDSEGTEIARSENAQHNRQYHSRETIFKEMLQSIKQPAAPCSEGVPVLSREKSLEVKEAS